ncbi:helix-turn-helix domain-containing protein [Bacillus sp. FJAT-28004]|uniref:helix-turn-helix domain-containing protein n=1 Tax=Bacillus sp. FJAT-28004 TaxID=1679165 RepID=UPI0006B40340|nr:AraC family transcriptional regulator [Bacillus sp. FJAT-28004]
MHIGTLFGLTPTVNFASRSYSEPGDSWGPRVIPDSQFFCVISGEALLQLGPDRYPILPGECVFYGSKTPHVLSVIRPTEFFSLHFSWNESSLEPVHPDYLIRDASPEEIREKADSCQLTVFGCGDITIPHHFSIAGVESLMMRIVKEYQNEYVGYPFVLRALLMELITVIVRNLGNRESGELVSKIEPALAIMREQSAKLWSVAELAKLCGYHPNYFTWLFYSEVGKNPKQYLIDERIKQAKQALLQGDPIDSIAESLGYASIHYFSNNFKKETGLTPREFRQLPDQKLEKV